MRVFVLFAANAMTLPMPVAIPAKTVRPMAIQTFFMNFSTYRTARNKPHVLSRFKIREISIEVDT